MGMLAQSIIAINYRDVTARSHDTCHVLSSSNEDTFTRDRFCLVKEVFFALNKEKKMG